MATAKQIAWRKKFVKLYGGKKKKSSRKKSMGTGDLSEEYYAERLRKKLGEKSLVFRTGKALGVPDIVAFSRGRISFYEIKPAEPSSLSNPTSIYLKVTQANWIKKNCLEKKNKAYIVYYLRRGKKGTKFTYRAIQLTKQNLKKYSQSSSKSSRIATLEKQARGYNRGKIRFT